MSAAASDAKRFALGVDHANKQLRKFEVVQCGVAQHCSYHRTIIAQPAAGGFFIAGESMTEFVAELRHYCRNPRCSSKLAKPVANPREAFCARGCYSSFYRKRCLVCESQWRRLSTH